MSTSQRRSEETIKSSNNQQKHKEEEHNIKDVHLKMSKHKDPQQFTLVGRQPTPNSNQSILHYHHNLAQSYWLIVEIESDNELNSYALVESRDIVGSHSIETLTTGKMLVVNIDNVQKKATVVMASNDRNFIWAEYNQLNKMAEDNLKLREMQSKKRRRISSPENYRKDHEDSSSSSVWTETSQKVQVERVLAPSAYVQQKAVNYPPMTYDQGTQTDSKSANSDDKSFEIKKLLEINEIILKEQRLLRNEVKMNRFLLDSLPDEFLSIKKNLDSIEKKLDQRNYNISQCEPIADISHNEKKSDDSKNIDDSSTQPYFIIETSQDLMDTRSLSLANSNMEYTVEEIEASSNGLSNSRLSLDQASMDSMKKSDYFSRNQSSSNFSVASSTPLACINKSSSLIEEWADMEGDVSIGSNQTTVPVHILRAIDWRNYKTATRKLLVTLFPRSILASRSLTGRPSPAFHDRNKPVKEKLDQNIINDIIQIVTRKCGVHESQVRTAITTKCADENKMMRNREGKIKAEVDTTKSVYVSTQNSHLYANDDKENLLNN